MEQPIEIGLSENWNFHIFPLERSFKKLWEDWVGFTTNPSHNSKLISFSEEFRGLPVTLGNDSAGLMNCQKSTDRIISTESPPWCFQRLQLHPDLHLPPICPLAWLLPSPGTHLAFDHSLFQKCPPAHQPVHKFMHSSAFHNFLIWEHSCSYLLFESKDLYNNLFIGNFISISCFYYTLISFNPCEFIWSIPTLYFILKPTNFFCKIIFKTHGNFSSLGLRYFYEVKKTSFKYSISFWRDVLQ